MSIAKEPLATVRAVMTPHPVTTTTDTLVQEAVLLMEELGCRHLPVLEADRLVGILAKKDVSCACSSSRQVGEVMNRKLHTATPDETVDVAAATMAVAKVDCLPVMEGDRLVGILTTYDVLDLVCRRFRADPGLG